MHVYVVRSPRRSRSSLHWLSDVTRTEKIYLYGTHRNSCPEFCLNIAGHFSSTLRTWTLQLAFELLLHCVDACIKTCTLKALCILVYAVTLDESERKGKNTCVTVTSVMRSIYQSLLIFNSSCLHNTKSKIRSQDVLQDI